MDYKETLNLPQTSFPMRGNLPQNEPRQVERWERENTYLRMLEVNAGNKKYILHDGPPYANGNIHLGHALNKILKDIIVKYKSLRGFLTPFVPGWDCHGLPIELQVEKSIGREKKKSLDKVEVRRQCKAYAEKYIAIQRDEFKRLGILGDWQKPYRTMDYAYEAVEIRELGKFISAGSLYRQKKPVYWCVSCVTALAEAEVEYEQHTSPSIYVKFPVKGDSKGRFTRDQAHFVIWTTTPWTLPANQAIAVHPRLTYRLVKTPAGNVVLAQELIPTLMAKFGFSEGSYEILSGGWSGAELEGIVCRHPWLDRESRVILADFVTPDQGTGSVHIAPGHGQEDYEVGQRYGLEVSAPVEAEGKFTFDAGDLAGEFVFKADRKIIQKLIDHQALLGEEQFVHAYAHCWRCKKPVIFRATEQWFISMENNDLRGRALEAIDKVTWIPPWGRERIRGMLESRPDWCISRQRSWGVPIPALYCNACRQIIVSEALCVHVASIFEKEGSDAWFSHSASELVPPALSCPGCGAKDFVKEEDILDVWFDSGVSHAAVVEVDPRLGGRASLYLEGSDQHRGWFHTSLLTSVGTRNRAPYESALTHGFTLDGNGRKMSKSLGNAISPQELIKGSGAEIVRLWASAEDYRDDVRISKEIVNRLVEAYRRVRNTARFLLGNLYDFDPRKDRVQNDELAALDQWILHRSQEVLSRCSDAYDRFEFHTVYHTLNNFCSVDLSALYLDIVKDRLYCEAANSKERRSAQTALYRILDVLVHLMAPILSFTAEEIWTYMPDKGDRPDSIFLSRLSTADQSLIDETLGDEWEKIFKVRGEILKGLEAARNEGLIGHSLDAKLTLYPDSYTEDSSFQSVVRRYAAKWPEIAIVSQVELAAGQAPLNGTGSDNGPRDSIVYKSPVLGGSIAVQKAEGQKCERCWTYRLSIGSDPSHPSVCARCSGVLASGTGS